MSHWYFLHEVFHSFVCSIWSFTWLTDEVNEEGIFLPLLPRSNQCFSGLEELEADDKWEAALAAVVVILVVVFVVLQVVALVGPRLKPTHSPERSRQPFQAEMS